MKFLIPICVILFFNFTVLAHDRDKKNIDCHEDSYFSFYHCHRTLNRMHLVGSSREKRTLTGIPKVTDGDSIRIGNTRVRLFGIDAPEANQNCTFRGIEWLCGWEATNALANIVGKHWVTCIQRDIDRYGRVVAVCTTGPIDLSAWMVVNGWARAYRRYSADYVKDEEKAQNAKRGIWRGDFVNPWEWRRPQ